DVVRVRPAAGVEPRGTCARRRAIRAVHQGRRARGVQGPAAGDRRRVRAANAAERRTADVRRDREGLPRDAGGRGPEGRMKPGDASVIIVRKKKKGHGGHHGGAWKVAYADFVTAMMAFFLVMWL